MPCFSCAHGRRWRDQRRAREVFKNNTKNSNWVCSAKIACGPAGAAASPGGARIGAIKLAENSGPQKARTIFGRVSSIVVGDGGLLDHRRADCGASPALSFRRVGPIFRNKMTITQLDEQSLDRFTGLSAWNEPVSTEPLPGPAPGDVVWSREAELDRIRTTVRTVLARNDGMSAETLFALKRPIAIAAHLGQASAEQFAVLSEICDILRAPDAPQVIASLQEEKAWNLAIAATRDARRFAEYDPCTLDTFSRQMAVAASCRRLKQRGYKIAVNGYGVAIDRSTLVRMCADIEGRVRELGGRRVIEAILRCFDLKGRVYEGSLLYGRTVSLIPQPRDPSIPWHFLYNIAWKHFDAVPMSKDPVRDLGELADLARDMAAVFDVEVYSSFDGVTIVPANVHQAFADRILYDELFAFQQWQPEAAARVFSSWLDHLAAVGCHFPLASMEEWKTLGVSLIAKAQPVALTITNPAEHSSLELSWKRATALFEVLSIPSNELNNNYATPLDTANRNTPYFPLYRLSPDVWVIPPRGMAARSTFERIYALLREANASNLETQMGAALERMAAEAMSLTGHAPAYVGLKYRIPGQRKREASYQLDIADESEECISFIECKKKPLTNAARAGNTLSAAADLASAFLMPLAQMNRHETQLRTSGISFDNGHFLTLKGRNIQRIAVTMTDHGSMQDRMFLRAVLIGLWGARFTAYNPVHQTTANKLNEQFKIIADGITALARQAGGTFEDFFSSYIRSSWWLSIDQLYFLCEHARNLPNSLSSIGGFVFGSGDFMNEIANCAQAGILKRKE